MKYEYLNFKKKGVVFDIKKIKEIRSHAWVPTPYLLDKNKIIVFLLAEIKMKAILYFIYDLEKKDY